MSSGAAGYRYARRLRAQLGIIESINPKTLDFEERSRLEAAATRAKASEVPAILII
jgi:hypothetical protein